MNIHVDVHIHDAPADDLRKLLEEVSPALRRIFEELKKMSVSLDRLTAEVSRNTTVTGSAIALIKGLAQQIKDAAADPAAVNALADQMLASTDAMAAAVAENTPGEQVP